jgi:hypothetical protein
MTPEQLEHVARFAWTELVAQDVPRPSVAAQIEQVRRIVAAGRGTEAGLHTLAGVVNVVVLDGEERGFLRGEFVLDVRVQADVKPADVRHVVGRWLGQRRRVIVRVREASLLDVVIAAIRWAWIRGRARRAIKALAR